MRKTKVGVIGCGNISGIYLQSPQTFEILEIVATSDLIMERTHGQSAKYNIPGSGTNAELLADPEIEIVLNITTPQSHYEVSMEALEAGKSVHNEKPLALTRSLSLLLHQRETRPMVSVCITSLVLFTLMVAPIRGMLSNAVTTPLINRSCPERERSDRKIMIRMRIEIILSFFMALVFESVYMITPAFYTILFHSGSG